MKSAPGPARPRRTQGSASSRLLAGLAAVVATVLVVGGAAAAQDAAVSETEDVLLFEEYVVPPTVEIPTKDSSPVARVVLTDTLTGLDVPLALEGVAEQNGKTLVHIPQLPPGAFLLTWDGGETRIEVRNLAGHTSYIDETGPGGQGSAATVLVLGLVATVIVGVVLRRRGTRRAVVVVLLVAGSGLAGAFALRSDAGTAPRTWETCALEQDPDDQLLCKSAYLVGELRDGRFTEVAELLKTNRDPMCHDVAHRAAFHIWRTTRDAALVSRMLIPGCDDGLIHGIAESIATFTSDRELAGQLVDFCTAATESFQVRACLHGGGHATIWRTNGNLEHAWAICREIPSDLVSSYDASEECLGSAVMEWADRWSTQRRQGERLIRPDLEEPMALCLDGPATRAFRQGCYLGTNHRTGDALKAARWCNEREPQLEACFSALGENLPYFETPITKIKLVPELALHHSKVCELAATGTAQEECARALSRVFTIMNVSKTLGSEVCTQIAPSLAPGCRAGIEEAEAKYRERGLTLP